MSCSGNIGLQRDGHTAIVLRIRMVRVIKSLIIKKFFNVYMKELPSYTVYLVNVNNKRKKKKDTVAVY